MRLVSATLLAWTIRELCSDARTYNTTIVLASYKLAGFYTKDACLDMLAGFHTKANCSSGKKQSASLIIFPLVWGFKPSGPVSISLQSVLTVHLYIPAGNRNGLQGLECSGRGSCTCGICQCRKGLNVRFHCNFNSYIKDSVTCNSLTRKTIALSVSLYGMFSRTTPPAEFNT